jgi:hypothetical protein
VRRRIAGEGGIPETGAETGGGSVPEKEMRLVDKRRRVRDAADKAGIITWEAVARDRASRGGDVFFRLVAVFEDSVGHVVEYFANSTIGDLLDDVLEYVVLVLDCDRPAQYDGTRVFNPFCLQFPQLLFRWPRWHDVVPPRIAHDPLIVAADCVDLDYPRTGRYPFDLPFDLCSLNGSDGQPRPLCPACDLCAREFDPDLAGFGKPLDVALMTVNLLELLLDGLTSTEIEGAVALEDRVHFVLNIVLLAVLAAWASMVLGLPGALVVFPVAIYLAAHGQISFALLLVAVAAYALLRSGLVAATFASAALLAAFFALMFSGTALAPRLDLVCWAVGPLTALRGVRPFRRHWLPALDVVIADFERSCYGVDPRRVPLAHIELYLLNFSKVTFMLLVAIVAYYVLLEPLLSLLARASAFLCAIVSAAIGLYLRVQMVVLGGRVSALEGANAVAFAAAAAPPPLPPEEGGHFGGRGSGLFDSPWRPPALALRRRRHEQRPPIGEHPHCL